MNGHLVIARMAFPVILANATVPLLGLADTAAIGHAAGAQGLGAIALGALVFSFLYWAFGFLRMGTTGFVAQAAGARDAEAVRVLVLRAVILAVIIGLVLLVLQGLVGKVALHLLDASEAVREGVRVYFQVRIWGAPATLTTFAVLGTLIGLGKTRHLLWLQLLLNGINILLNVLFVIGLGWGVAGIAAGTVVAEWIAAVVGVWMVQRLLNEWHPAGRWPIGLVLSDRRPFLLMVRVNGNIMVRTLALLSGFAWFTHQGSRFGDSILAANHVLLQFVSFAAFFLDGYAHVVEMMVGKAIGARDEQGFRTGLRQANELAGATAFLLSVLFFGFGTPAIHGLTGDADVQVTAQQYLPFACGYILVSFYAFQLDGVFIGAMRSLEMRNAGLFSLGVFLICSIVLTPRYGNTGLWLAFIGYVIVRGLSLAYYLPRVRVLFS